MLEPTTLIYALVGAFGLIGADAYYNSSTLHIETSVAPIYEQRGYNRDVVESIFSSELENIANVPSVVPHPLFVTSKHKPISSALADAAHLQDPFEAAKAAVGITYSMVRASVVVDSIDGKDVPKIVVSGNTNDVNNFSFTVPLTSSSSVDLVLAEAAFLTMNKIAPYLAVLYAFNRAEKNGVHPSQADSLVAEWIKHAPTAAYSPERALFENLSGLSSLLDNDPVAAEAWFTKANKSDPELQPAILNLGFMALYSGYSERAIELFSQVAETSFWSRSLDDRTVYAANVGLGIALANQGKFEESDSHFREAVTMMPNGVSGYYYWARSILKQGRSAEAKALVETAMRNAKQIVNYSELASLYFWLPEQTNGTLERRTRDLPKSLGMLFSPANTSQ